MGRIAGKVYTEAADLARLERRVTELPVNARVRVHTRDRGAIEGVVTVTPTVQAFRDAADNEGTNGVVKLEDPGRPGWTEVVWLDEITRVDHLDSVTKGSSRA